MALFNMFDDNFFSPFGAMTQMRRHPGTMPDMNQMMASMFPDPFGGELPVDNFFMGPNRARPLMGFPSFGFPNMMGPLTQMTNDPNCHSYHSSSLMSYTTGPDGRPQVYQESRSTRQAPGGLRETHKSVCDSVSGKKQLEIGHHIHEKGHVMEKEKNIYTGDEEERQELINLDDDEVDDFGQEWQRRTQQQYRPQSTLPQNRSVQHHRNEQLAIAEGPSNSYESENRRSGERPNGNRNQEKKVKRLKGSKK